MNHLSFIQGPQEKLTVHNRTTYVKKDVGVKGVRVTWENLPGVDLYVDTEPSNPVQFLNASMQIWL